MRVQRSKTTRRSSRPSEWSVIRGALILCAGAIAFVAASPASAQGDITNVRVSNNAAFDRIVFDLSSAQIDAIQATSAGELVLKITGTRPNLSRDRAAQLDKTRARIETNADGDTLVSIQLRGRSTTAFRLRGPERLVLDIARAGEARRTVPGDATPVPEVPYDVVVGRSRGGSTVASVDREAQAREAFEREQAERRALEEERRREEEQRELARQAREDRERRLAEERRVEEERVAEAARREEADRQLRIAEDERREREEREERQRAERETQVAMNDPVETSFDTPSIDARPAVDQSSDDLGPGPDAEGGWVLVRAIEITGMNVEDGVPPSQDDILNLVLPVSPERGGYVAPRKGKPVQRMPLRALTGDDRNGRRLSGALLQVILDEIAFLYSRQDRYGTEVEIRPTDYLQLKNPGSDGRLVITVTEKPRDPIEKTSDIR